MIGSGRDERARLAKRLERDARRARGFAKLRSNMRVPALTAVFSLLAAFVPVAACYSGSTSAPSSGPPTFHKDVAPILQTHCQGCHTQGGIAPFSLLTFDDAKANAANIVAQTGARNMPPWGAQETSECTPPFKWKHDERLSDAQIKTLHDWHAAGELEGDPKDAPPPRTPPSDALANPSVELKPQGPYTVADPSNDNFRCFVIDPKLTTTQYVNGSQVLPGNKTIVHHVLVFTDPMGESAKKQLGPDGGYDCFGGVGLQNTQLLAAWAPGAPAIDYPPNVGLKVDPGTKYVMQVHYHPHSATASLAPDLTSFQVRYTQGVPEWSMLNALIGNFDKQEANGDGLQPDPASPATPPKFVIPANQRGVVKTMKLTVPPMANGGTVPTLYVYGVGGHMHYVGTDVKVSIHHRTANDSPDGCMVQIPRWDFNWQRFYYFDADIQSLPSVKPFDSIEIRCTYDNSMENPKMRGALVEQGLSQPRDVSLGETTLDEMCLGVFALIYKP